MGRAARVRIQCASVGVVGSWQLAPRSNFFHFSVCCRRFLLAMPPHPSYRAARLAEDSAEAGLRDDVPLNMWLPSCFSGLVRLLDQVGSQVDSRA